MAHVVKCSVTAGTAIISPCDVASASPAVFGGGVVDANAARNLVAAM